MRDRSGVWLAFKMKSMKSEQKTDSYGQPDAKSARIALIHPLFGRTRVGHMDRCSALPNHTFNRTVWHIAAEQACVEYCASSTVRTPRGHRGAWHFLSYSVLKCILTIEMILWPVMTHSNFPTLIYGMIHQQRVARGGFGVNTPTVQYVRNNVQVSQSPAILWSSRSRKLTHIFRLIFSRYRSTRIVFLTCEWHVSHARTRALIITACMLWPPCSFRTAYAYVGEGAVRYDKIIDSTIYIIIRQGYNNNLYYDV